MNKRWLFKPIPEKENIEALSKSININGYLSAILLQRGIDTYEDAKKFFGLHSGIFMIPF